MATKLAVSDAMTISEAATSRGVTEGAIRHAIGRNELATTTTRGGRLRLLHWRDVEAWKPARQGPKRITEEATEFG